MAKTKYEKVGMGLLYEDRGELAEKDDRCHYERD